MNETKDSAVPRDFHVKLQKHFTAISAPSDKPTELPTPKEEVSQLLTPASQEEASVLSKEQELVQVRQSLLKPGQDAIALKLLRAAEKDIQEFLDSHKVRKTPSAKDVVKNRERLAKARAEYEVAIERRKESQKEHVEKAHQKKEVFLADLKAARAQLQQLEEQYEMQTKEAAEKWVNKNAMIDRHKMQVLDLIKQQQAGAVTITDEQDTADQSKASPRSAAQVQTQPEIPIWMRQLKHRADVYPYDLRDFSQFKPSPQEIEYLDKVAAWIQQMQLEQEVLPYTFGMCDLSLQAVAAMLGEGAMEKLFAVEKGSYVVHADDVVSEQVRALINDQLLEMSAALANAREEKPLPGKDWAKKAAAKHLPGLRKSILKTASAGSASVSTAETKSA